RLLMIALCLTAPGSVAAQPAIQVKETPDAIDIETDALRAQIRKRGYVSGIAQGSFIDKKTGARDAGFGLHIMDFLLAPGWRDDGYSRDPKVHGHLPTHYLDGPQICTRAGRLPVDVVRGEGFVAVRLRHRFTEASRGLRVG